MIAFLCEKNLIQEEIDQGVQNSEVDHEDRSPNKIGIHHLHPSLGFVCDQHVPKISGELFKTCYVKGV
jgi:hypothetical protein